MIDKDKNTNWWRPAIVIFGEVSTWIVVPIIVALVFGKMLDTHYGTKPVIFLIFAAAGFLFSCFGIVRVISRYMKEIKKIAEEKPEKK